MNFELRELNEIQAKQLCGWKYSGEYSIYNFPDWETILKQNWAIGIKETRQKEYLAVVGENEELNGFIRFENTEHGIVVGLGLKPDLCGNGFGKEIMILVKQESMKRYGMRKIVLEVRPFNKRAIRCYQNAGFKTVKEYKRKTPIGIKEFYWMEFSFPHKELSL